MADHISPERRSWLMSRVRSKHTSPEMRVRRAAHALGLRFRLHRKDLPGKPDLVFPKHRVVLFVHGCFWHGHRHCKYYVVPKTRTDWWLDKIKKNITNDSKAVGALTQQGWKIITLWECELKSSNLEKSLSSLVNSLQ